MADEIPEDVREVFREYGRQGGKIGGRVRAKKLSAAKRKRIAQEGGRASAAARAK